MPAREPLRDRSPAEPLSFDPAVVRRVARPVRGSARSASLPPHSLRADRHLHHAVALMREQLIRLLDLVE